MLLHLHHSISFTRQILADLQKSSAPTTVNQVNYFFDLFFEKPFTGAPSDDPSAWLRQGDFINFDKINLRNRLNRTVDKTVNQGLTLVLDRHSHKVSAATVAEDFKG